MLEGIIFGFAVFVAGYVMLMRLMARRADVLHGEFIQGDQLPQNGRGTSLIAAIRRDARKLGFPAK